MGRHVQGRRDAVGWARHACSRCHARQRWHQPPLPPSSPPPNRRMHASGTSSAPRTPRVLPCLPQPWWRR